MADAGPGVADGLTATRPPAAGPGGAIQIEQSPQGRASSPATETRFFEMSCFLED